MRRPARPGPLPRLPRLFARVLLSGCSGPVEWGWGPGTTHLAGGKTRAGLPACAVPHSAVPGCGPRLLQARLWHSHDAGGAARPLPPPPLPSFGAGNAILRGPSLMGPPPPPPPTPLLPQDHVAQPYEDLLPYEDFSLRLNNGDLPRLREILRVSGGAGQRLGGGGGGGQHRAMPAFASTSHPALCEPRRSAHRAPHLPSPPGSRLTERHAGAVQAAGGREPAPRACLQLEHNHGRKVGCGPGFGRGSRGGRAFLRAG